ncbi:macrophage migration inhibitory factor (MIF) [Plasmodium ovale curtisi]|uniref:L-dopachrome isomerase n=1 Tax=Plasmodium ovale curtisi TaxID=864141 RepID=A0A1A8W9K8_PLAOA|nr:macrophage migration inhibitory factor (MIF) [Plasmodium ovale curtisi]
MQLVERKQLKYEEAAQIRGSSSNTRKQLKYKEAAQVREIHEGHSIVRFVPVFNGALYMVASPTNSQYENTARYSALSFMKTVYLLILVESTLSQIEGAISDVLGKPPAYIMSNYDYQKNMRFSGTNEAYCFVRLTSIGGINKSNNSSLADKITNILVKSLKVKSRRVYIEFRDCPAYNFAFSGSLFG